MHVGGVGEVVNLWALLVYHTLAHGAAAVWVVRVLVDVVVSVLIQLLHAHLVGRLRQRDVAATLAL